MLQPTAPPISRVVCYVRVSTQEQARGHSLDSQRKQLAEWAAARGWEIVRIFEDAGGSGTSVEGRPAFQAMIREAERGEFEAVLVARIDRFSRNLADQALYWDLLARNGVTVLSQAEPSASDGTPAGFLMRGFSGLIAAHTSVALSANVTRGKQTRWEKGLPNGMPPFGYAQIGDPRMEPPSLVLREAEMVARAFQLFATGTASYRDIAADLNAAGFRTRRRGRRADPNDGPRAWSGDSVRKMISISFYKGVVSYKGEERPGRHEAIVSEAVWQGARRVAQRLRGQATTRRRKRIYPLAGIAVCDRCGQSLQGNATGSGGRHRYYRHDPRRRGMTCVRPQRAVRADWLEAAVGAVVERMQMPPDVREQVLALLRDDGDDDGEQRRQQLQERLRRVRRLYADLQLDDADYDHQRRALEAELDRLDVPPAQAQAAVDTFTLLQTAWAKATPEELRGLALHLFERVAVDVEHKCVVNVVVNPSFRPWVRQEGVDDDLG